MTLTPNTLRRDASRPCGQSHIPSGHTCHKKGSFPTRNAIAAGLGVAALGLGAYALSRRNRAQPVNPDISDPWDSPFTPRPPRPTSPAPQPAKPLALPGDRTTRQITGITPKALLPPGRRPKSKTQRMRENTQAAVRNAEQAMGRAAQAEITRAGAVANAMAAAGEATGMAAKTTLRQLRLRTEAARRRFEPGYRSNRPSAPKPPAQLNPGMDPELQIPFNPQPQRSPEAAPDPRTGQPRRRKPRGFGRTDNYIPFYAPVALRNIQ